MSIGLPRALRFLIGGLSATEIRLRRDRRTSDLTETRSSAILTRQMYRLGTGSCTWRLRYGYLVRYQTEAVFSP